MSEGDDVEDLIEEMNPELGEVGEADVEADPAKARFIREIADEVRGDSSESAQVAALLYRVSDLYDPDEDTSPQEIYLNMRNILNVKAQGGIER